MCASVHAFSSIFLLYIAGIAVVFSVQAISLFDIRHTFSWLMYSFNQIFSFLRFVRGVARVIIYEKPSLYTITISIAQVVLMKFIHFNRAECRIFFINDDSCFSECRLERNGK